MNHHLNLAIQEAKKSSTAFDEGSVASMEGLIVIGKQESTSAQRLRKRLPSLVPVIVGLSAIILLVVGLDAASGQRMSVSPAHLTLNTVKWSGTGAATHHGRMAKVLLRVRQSLDVPTHGRISLVATKPLPSPILSTRLSFCTAAEDLASHRSCPPLEIFFLSNRWMMSLRTFAPFARTISTFR